MNFPSFKKSNVSRKATAWNSFYSLCGLVIKFSSFLWFNENYLTRCWLVCCSPSEPAPPTPTASEPSSLPRVSSRSYDLQERRRTGNMTGTEQAKYQRIPTDEFEAQTLASAHLDGIKSEFIGSISVFLGFGGKSLGTDNFHSFILHKTCLLLFLRLFLCPAQTFLKDLTHQLMVFSWKILDLKSQ